MTSTIRKNHEQCAECLFEVTIRPMPRYHKQGRPGSKYRRLSRWCIRSTGSQASSLAAWEALVVQQSYFILATNELDHGKLPP